jgi:peptidoglycan/LPS O-acetylase OafA/YrhL
MRMADLNYRPEIDGLRAIAVIPVILFHLGFGSIPGGFIGVDVFFVISGFLITSIIKKELDQGSFSLRNFWKRRVRRILPAMAFVTATTLILCYFFAFRPDQQGIGKQALAALLSLANIYFWQTSGDYWGNEAEESPFLHMWSLSVEEQFYLFFPVLMWLVYRFRPRWLKACIFAITISSLFLFLWGMTIDRDATFYLLPTRAWELGTGCLIAVSLNHRSPRNSKFSTFAIIGLGMIVASYLLVDQLNGSLILAVAGAALIIAYGHTGLTFKLLSNRSVVHIGKLSYSLYLWHWPLIVLANRMNPDPLSLFHKLVLVVLAYLLALGTYHVVEKPTRRRKRISPFVLSGGIVAVAAYAMAVTPRYYGSSDVNRGVFYLEYYNIHPEKQFPSSDPRHLSFDIPAREHDNDIYKTGGIITLRNDSSPDVVLLGDSLAIQWARNIDLIAEKHNLSTAFYAMYSWNPFCTIPPSGDKTYMSSWQRELDEAMLSYLKKWKPKAVVIGQRWIHHPNSVERCIPLIEFLGQNGIQVLLIEMTGELKTNPVNAVQEAARDGIKPLPKSKVYVPTLDEDYNRIPHELAARFSHVTVVKIYDLYTQGGSQYEQTLLFEGLDPVFVDGVHLSQYGAMIALPKLEEAILKAMK